MAGEHDFGRHLERLLRASGQELPAARPILELNPTHPLVKRLEQETGDRFGEWVEILFDQALLAEGSQLENPSAFVGRLNRMLLELSGGA